MYCAHLLRDCAYVRVEPVHGLVYHPQRLLEGFFKLSTNGHHLSYAFHGATNLTNRKEIQAWSTKMLVLHMQELGGQEHKSG